MLVNCVYIPFSYSFLFDRLDGVRTVALSWETSRKIQFAGKSVVHVADVGFFSGPAEEKD